MLEIRSNRSFGRLRVPCALAVLLSACGAEPGEPATTPEALTGGAAIRAEGTPALLIENGCSAVKIGPRNLITAAHCVLHFNSSTGFRTSQIDMGYRQGDDIRIANSSTGGSSAAWFKTKVVYTSVHPSMSSACFGGCTDDVFLLAPYPVDIAIVTLADDFPSSFGLSASLSSASPGQWVYKGGYGCENGFSGGPPNPPRFKIQGAALLPPAAINPYGNVSNTAAFGATNHVTAARNTGGAASLCYGDSGGPVFFGTFANGGNLVAINTGADSTDSNRDVHARIDGPGVKSWIEDVLRVVGSGGLDPTTHYDNCAGAQAMCSIGRKREYLTLAQRCDALGGQVPPCAFPDAATVCMQAAMACAQRDATAWSTLSAQCASLGGPVPACDLSRRIRLPWAR